ncbi:hypothetical protein F4778DRAFT_269979 [Xylariomycetidae sp. FL2044]|nr:hypothetical protein F4778DRAFT_269979 [Xylariomycetidae sp. FL2044]
MQLLLTTLVLAAATTTTTASVIPRDGARLAQFRQYGAEGCFDLNDGVSTVDASDAGLCHSLVFDGVLAVKSLNLEYQYSPAADGCSFYIYTDTACAEGQTALSVNACGNVASAGESWQSWTISCPSEASAAAVTSSSA